MITIANLVANLFILALGLFFFAIFSFVMSLLLFAWLDRYEFNWDKAKNWIKN